MLRLSPQASLLGLSVLAASALIGCNQPPTAPTIAITPDAPTTLDDLVAQRTAEATDPNDDPLSYGYVWERRASGAAEDAWIVVDDLAGNTVPSGRTRKGDSWRVSVTVSDGAETDTVEDVAPVTVQNSLPEIIRVRLSPLAGVDTFGTLTASASAEDVDGDDIDITYTWYVNGTALGVDGPILTGDHFDKGDSVHVEATPNDGEASGEPAASASVTILNTPPRLDAVTISPEEIFEDTEVLCTAVGWYDADGDPPDVTATWLVNGVEVEGVTGALTGEYFDKGDLIRCKGAPTDGDSQGAIVVSQVAQVLNSAPTLGGVELSLSAPTAADTLAFTPVDAADPDGDTVQYTAEWFVDGASVGTGLTLPPRSFVRGQAIHVVVTPNDGHLTGEAITSGSVTAANSPPSLTGVSLIPDPVYTNSVVFPRVTAEDLDGDPVTYTVTWTVNGSAVSETGSVLDGDVWFDKDDTIAVEVTPNDGFADGPTLASSTVTVQNSLPTLPVIELVPEEPTPGDELWCAVDTESTDADGDDLSYTFTWTRNGSEFTETGELDYPGDYVAGDQTFDGDSFVCTLEVSDGTAMVEVTAEADVLIWRGPRQLTTCGQVGRYGPSQSTCDRAYTGTTLEGDVLVSSGIQSWTAPLDGTYRIEARGAQGGMGSSYSTYSGALGARVRGDFELSEGDVLYFIVGQMGEIGGGSYAGGGGGGTFVFLNSVDEESLLLVGAGGGGNGYSLYSASTCGGQSPGVNPRTGSSSSSGSCSEDTEITAGEGNTYFYRLSGTTDYYYGGGGAGLNSDGTTIDASWRSYSPLDESNPAVGGEHPYNEGGFGGGGPGGYFYRYSSGSSYTSSSYGSGGGGGYTGGQGGYYRAGGGSSYNDGSNQSNTSNTHTGDGRVDIDLMD